MERKKNTETQNDKKTGSQKPMTNFQNAFAFALPTRIVYGPGCVVSLPAQLKELGGKRVLIVTDQGVRHAGILSKIEDLLRQAEVDFAVYDGVEANPKDANVAEGARLARVLGADCIIAAGGGSPIDCAKSVGVLLAHDADDIRKYEGKTAASKPQLPLISVPTTAGTGSELTFSSVITHTGEQRKMTIKSPYTAAAVAICDPELTRTVPPQITASTGMDALTHAIEAYTAKGAEPISDALALYAIELIVPHLQSAVTGGEDMEARSALLLGSMMAGIAFSHSDVASVHCIAEALGGVYDLPHGVCNAVFLPHVMEYSKDYATERYARIARAMGIDPESVEAGAQSAVDAVRQLAADVGLPRFADLIADTGAFERLADLSAKNISTESNPRPMTAEDYLKVIQNAYAHKPGSGPPRSRY